MRAWEIHPAVVHFPIAFLLGGVVLDLFGRHSEAAVVAATYLLIAGLATAAVAAGTPRPVLSKHFGKPNES